jgi:hypothetical protein
MSENRRKAALWAIATLLVLAAAGGFYYISRQNAGPDDGAVVTDGDGSPSSTATGTLPKPATKPLKLVNDVTAPSLTYTQASAIFANTLITFNEDCQMVPNPILVKSGTTLMFDNRSRNARTFKLDGVSYTIPGYGFKLFQLRSTKLPHVVKVECGSNTGEITLN